MIFNILIHYKQHTFTSNNLRNTGTFVFNKIISHSLAMSSQGKKNARRSIKYSQVSLERPKPSVHISFLFAYKMAYATLSSFTYTHN